MHQYSRVNFVPVNFIDKLYRNNFAKLIFAYAVIYICLVRSTGVKKCTIAVCEGGSELL